MPTIETLTRQANRLDLTKDTDFVVRTYTSRTSHLRIPVLELTAAGKEKRAKIVESLFNQNLPEYSLPLGNNFTINQLSRGDVINFDGLLALSLIRRRTGGYVCTFTDNFSDLEKESYQASIQHIDPAKKTVRLLFDHWPGEYHHYDYFLEKPNLTLINEPITVGPECVVDFQVLQDGKPHENLVFLVKNVVRRNLIGRK